MQGDLFFSEALSMAPSGSLIRSGSVLVAPQLQGAARGYWGNWGFFCSAPQDFVVLGVFCARFPPREASLYFSFLLHFCNSV